MEICRRCVVQGHVQGVFFRQNAYEKAVALGVKGWVRNCEDGTVECKVCGEPPLVELMCEWLKVGPPAASVENFKLEDIPLEEYHRFEILY